MGIIDRSSVGCGGVSLFAVLSVSAAPFLPHPLPSKLQYCYCAILTVRLSMCGYIVIIKVTSTPTPQHHKYHDAADSKLGNYIYIWHIYTWAMLYRGPSNARRTAGVPGASRRAAPSV
jgi:hypothetical protein